MKEVKAFTKGQLEGLFESQLELKRLESLLISSFPCRYFLGGRSAAECSSIFSSLFSRVSNSNMHAEDAKKLNFAKHSIRSDSKLQDS